MQKLTLKVHSVAEQHVPVTAELHGKPVEALIPALVVELVSADGSVTLTPRFTEDLEKARALFAQGAPITVTFAPGKES